MLSSTLTLSATRIVKCKAQKPHNRCSITGFFNAVIRNSGSFTVVADEVKELAAKLVANNFENVKCQLLTENKNLNDVANSVALITNDTKGATRFCKQRKND